MSFFKLKAKRDRVDDLFSKFIRARGKWRCQRCGRQWPDGSAGLTCSHFFGRRMESVRFDPENCDALCMFPCHDEWENEKGIFKLRQGRDVIEYPRAYRAWKITQLGPVRFAALEVRAHTTVKKDRKMSLIYVKALRAEAKKEEGKKIVGGKV